MPVDAAQMFLRDVAALPTWVLWLMLTCFAFGFMTGGAMSILHWLGCPSGYHYVHHTSREMTDEEKAAFDDLGKAADGVHDSFAAFGRAVRTTGEALRKHGQPSGKTSDGGGDSTAKSPTD